MRRIPTPFSPLRSRISPTSRNQDPGGFRLALACSGLGHVFRGYERFVDSLAVYLEDSFGPTVFKGAGTPDSRSRVVPCLKRRAGIGRWVSRLLGPTRAYHLEALTFGLFLFPALVLGRYDAVFVADYPLGRTLHLLRRLVPSSLRPVIIFHNGAPVSPRRLRWAELVQQLTRDRYLNAIELGLTQSRLVPIPIDVSRARSCPSHHARSQLGLPTGGFIVLCVAAHEPFKRIHLAIRGVAHLESSILAEHDVHLLVCGEDGSCTASLHQLADRLLPGRVHFQRYPFRDADRTFSAADACIACSQGEGFGIAILEAMAAGVPTIVDHDLSDRLHLRDAVISVDTSDSRAVADAMRRLILDPRLRAGMAEAARNCVVQDFSWEACSTRYFDLLDEARAISRRRRRALAAGG